MITFKPYKIYWDSIYREEQFIGMIIKFSDGYFFEYDTGKMFHLSVSECRQLANRLEWRKVWLKKRILRLRKKGVKKT